MEMKKSIERLDKFGQRSLRDECKVSLVYYKIHRRFLFFFIENRGYELGLGHNRFHNSYL